MSLSDYSRSGPSELGLGAGLGLERAIDVRVRVGVRVGLGLGLGEHIHILGLSISIIWRGRSIKFMVGCGHRLTIAAALSCGEGLCFCSSSHCAVFISALSFSASSQFVCVACGKVRIQYRSCSESSLEFWSMAHV